MSTSDDASSVNDKRTDSSPILRRGPSWGHPLLVRSITPVRSINSLQVQVEPPSEPTGAMSRIESDKGKGPQLSGNATEAKPSNSATPMGATSNEMSHSAQEEVEVKERDQAQANSSVQQSDSEVPEAQHDGGAQSISTDAAPNTAPTPEVPDTDSDMHQAAEDEIVDKLAAMSDEEIGAATEAYFELPKPPEQNAATLPGAAADMTAQVSEPVPRINVIQASEDRSADIAAAISDIRDFQPNVDPTITSDASKDNAPTPDLVQSTALVSDPHRTQDAVDPQGAVPRTPDTPAPSLGSESLGSGRSIVSGGSSSPKVPLHRRMRSKLLHRRVLQGLLGRDLAAQISPAVQTMGEGTASATQVSTSIDHGAQRS